MYMVFCHKLQWMSHTKGWPMKDGTTHAHLPRRRQVLICRLLALALAPLLLMTWTGPVSDGLPPPSQTIAIGRLVLRRFGPSRPRPPAMRAAPTWRYAWCSLPPYLVQAGVL